MMEELMSQTNGKTAAKMLEEASERLELAERSLRAAGFTQASPSNQWKPPVGPSASPLLQLVDDLSAQRDELLALVNEFAGAMQECGDWPDTTSSMASLARIAERSRNYISQTKRRCRMSNHTPEPWPPFIDVCEPATPHPDSNGIVCLGFDDYRRARACVNACRGLGTDELEQHGLASAVGYELIELTGQRDELLRDMHDVLDMLTNQPHAVTAANQAEDMLRLSIGTAKHFGKAGSGNHSPDMAKMVVQEGWQLVPVEPTIEMVQAATHSVVGFGTRAAYQAMLAAAPKPEGGAA